jgi:hypothetical protein
MYKTEFENRYCAASPHYVMEIQDFIKKTVSGNTVRRGIETLLRLFFYLINQKIVHREWGENLK